MLQAPQNEVSRELQSRGVELQQHVSFGKGLEAAVWRNPGMAPDQVPVYDRPGHHTLSLYLEGGYKVRRLDDTKAGESAPGKLCLLPANHQSRWFVGDSLRMFHLYITPDYLNYLAQSTLDLDPRQLELKDETFKDSPFTESVVNSVFLSMDWQGETDRMALGNAAQLLIFDLLKNHSDRARNLTVRGGLSPRDQRLLKDFIEAHLDQPLTLDDLADQIGLSPYHLARMFKLSFGIPPHKFVMAQRLERAEDLLRHSGMGLAEIALECGFSSQSHFSNSFKAAKGLTPRAFRTL
ncbi:helix-turn-helix domain-containing protein [Aestuariispira insulae]|uniref:AraC family transcriptional regulator n=1 Tax=Aestuariispira insulae TaxID=1461337 RepID=A0A3D9HGL8_9PROT|nr:AraC family transcriptional regulator [Aestuariispira insulae]RED48610.1 AraC family transcriptional regulator [Aestuariispira insulae]